MDDGGMSQSAAAAISSLYFALPVCTRNRSPPSLKSLQTMGFKTLRGKLVFCQTLERTKLHHKEKTCKKGRFSLLRAHGSKIFGLQGPLLLKIGFFVSFYFLVGLNDEQYLNWIGFTSGYGVSAISQLQLCGTKRYPEQQLAKRK